MPRNPCRASVASPPMSPRSVFPTPTPTPTPAPAPAPPSSPLPLPPPPSSSSATEDGSTHPPPRTEEPPPGSKAVNVPTIDPSVRIDSPTFSAPAPASSSSPSSSAQHPRPIYRGLVSDDYPELLLPPSAVPSIDVRVASSRLRPSRTSYLALKPSEDDPVFTLSVISRATRAELWRVEKVIVALAQLDQQVRQFTKLPVKLPDRSIFSGHSPAKIDARRAALNAYFAALLECPLDEAALLVICQFLTADAIEPRDDETSFVNNAKTPIARGPDGKPRMEGYLTKRGKNFGGWKSRYFVLHGPELKYYDSPGGPHLGTIKIRHAQIGTQTPQGTKNPSPSQSDDDSDNQYRHAFLILEPKKKDSTALVRHVLCAECDEERDAWVQALLSYVEDPSDEESTAPPGHHKSKHGKSRRKSSLSKKGSKDMASGADGEPVDTLRALSYDDVVAAEAPIRGGSVLPGGPGPGMDQTTATTPRNISAPTNGAVIQDAQAWGVQNPNTPTTVKQKKLSIWGFRGPSSTDTAANVGRQDSVSSSHGPAASASERKEPARTPVFGLALAEAVELCPPRGVEDTGLPSVVYRCIEYLKAQHVEMEEGIFRLSGSNVIIKGLKERFNNEGDLDFLEGDVYYDVHAVASLFKQYLRELPVTVLTRELHLDFIHVLDLKEKEQKIAAFHSLVHQLPTPNLTLLKALSQFLLIIVNNADVNKMTVRNVGIVFAPTLNIPAPVFSMFLTEYDLIFGDDPPEWLVKKMEEVKSLMASSSSGAGQESDEVRSPRHQMFTDLPTPSPGYSSFPTAPMRQEMPDTGGADESAAMPREHRRDNYAAGAEQAADSSQLHPHPHPHRYSEAHFGSMNGLLAPGNNGASQPMSKSKRRESSLLFMGMGLGNRKNSMPKIRDDGEDS
ncbi:hypothetical protein VTO42DRAFT_2429 [Malbranchea cinnamomea]